MHAYSSNNTNKLSPQERNMHKQRRGTCSNNTNKLSPQEPRKLFVFITNRSNNTNKLSPQERFSISSASFLCSNNTNKLSPQERILWSPPLSFVQIIQINLVLKNLDRHSSTFSRFK